MIDYYKNLKPLHLFLFGTIFILLARTIKTNLFFELGTQFIALLFYILALIKLLKK